MPQLMPNCLRPSSCTVRAEFRVKAHPGFLLFQTPRTRLLVAETAHVVAKPAGLSQRMHTVFVGAGKIFGGHFQRDRRQKGRGRKLKREASRRRNKLIATIRSREISASIILQSQSQLKTIYKDAAETITGNCDTVLFLGGKESSTLKEISETLGKETIDLYNTSDTRGSNRSYGLNYQKTGKELMSRDELAVMDGEKCILQLRGVRPFLSNKYDITKHKRYKELADFNKNNAFDVEKYLAHRLVMSEDTEFEMYEVTVTQEDVSVIEAEEGED